MTDQDLQEAGNRSISQIADDAESGSLSLVRKAMEKERLLNAADAQNATHPPDHAPPQGADRDTMRGQRRGLGAVVRQGCQGAWRLLDPVRRYRPTRLHQVVVITALIVVLKPWLLPLVVALVAAVSTITYLTLGPDRCAELAQSADAWVTARNPVLAEKLCKGCAEFRTRLPGQARVADTHELTGSLSVQEKMKSDPFDRLAAQARNL